VQTVRVDGTDALAVRCADTASHSASFWADALPAAAFLHCRTTSLISGPS